MATLLQDLFTTDSSIASGATRNCEPTGTVTVVLLATGTGIALSTTGGRLRFANSNTTTQSTATLRDQTVRTSAAGLTVMADFIPAVATSFALRLGHLANTSTPTTVANQRLLLYLDGTSNNAGGLVVDGVSYPHWNVAGGMFADGETSRHMIRYNSDGTASVASQGGMFADLAGGRATVGSNYWYTWARPAVTTGGNVYPMLAVGRPTGNTSMSIDADNWLVSDAPTVTPSTDCQLLAYGLQKVGYHIPAILHLSCSGGSAVLLGLWQEGTAHSAADVQIVCRKSTDGGATWGSRVVIADVPANTQYTNKAGAFYRRPNGDIWAIYSLCDTLVDADRGTLYRAISSDGGATWSAPAALVLAEEFTGSHLSLSFGNILEKDGRIHIPIQSTYAGIGHNRTLYSDDGGATWTPSAEVSLNALIVEGSVVPGADGWLYQVFRTGEGYCRISQSRDNGETWSETRLTTIPNAASRTMVRDLGDGTWLWIGNDSTTSRRAITLWRTTTGESPVVLGKQLVADVRQTNQADLQYPDAVVVGGSAHVLFAMQKNSSSIQYSRVDATVLNDTTAPYVTAASIRAPGNVVRVDLPEVTVSAGLAANWTLTGADASTYNPSAVALGGGGTYITLTLPGGASTPVSLAYAGTALADAGGNVTGAFSGVAVTDQSAAPEAPAGARSTLLIWEASAGERYRVVRVLAGGATQTVQSDAVSPYTDDYEGTDLAGYDVIPYNAAGDGEALQFRFGVGGGSSVRLPPLGGGVVR